MKYLDPCCGTGSFLLKVSEKFETPKNIFGCDIDKTACFIAKINLIIKFKNIIFKPQIYNIDVLKDTQILKNEDFDIIATNPPWGSMTESEYKNYILKYFQENLFHTSSLNLKNYCNKMAIAYLFCLNPY